MLEEYLNGKLEHVSPNAARNALWYMSHTLKMGSERFDEIVYSTPLRTFSLRSMAAFIRSEARNRAWPEIESKAAADENFIRQFLFETTTLVDQTKLRYELRTRGWSPAPTHSLDLEMELGSAIDSHLAQIPATQTFERWKNL